MMGPIWSSGTLRTSKMPACLHSHRNTVLSWILVCTVAVTVISKMPSATFSALTPRLISTDGCSWSSRMAGELGCSSEASFR